MFCHTSTTPTCPSVINFKDASDMKSFIIKKGNQKSSNFEDVPGDCYKDNE
jgi:hypothetical protein